MIRTLHDERRRQHLLTQTEVAKIAGCSVGRLQNHTRKGHLELPSQRLGSRFYYNERQAKEIKTYFECHQRWERREGRADE
jgi:hypothetical protein